jgi:hypothetical protein
MGRSELATKGDVEDATRPLADHLDALCQR